MQYAVIETGGKQLIVKPGDYIFVEKLDAYINKKYIFDKVLCLFDEKNLIIGYPYIDNCVVESIIEKHSLTKKINVFKFKAKSNERKMHGHRQQYTKLKIEKISIQDNKNDKNNK